MFLQTPASETVVQPLSQVKAQLHYHNQKFQAAARVAQSLKYRFQIYKLQQNVGHQAFHVCQPSSHPHLFQPLGGPGQQLNNSNSNNNSASPTTLSTPSNVPNLPPEPPIDETLDLEDLEEFAKSFKQRRIKLGFTQGDVGLALGKLYGYDCSQRTVSRFEALNLSFSNMCKLKPWLERWLQEKEKSLSNSNARTQSNAMPAATGRRRKKRTFISCQRRVALERAFMQNVKPSTAEIKIFAKTLGMEREVVRLWFCTRRQKEKRLVCEGIGGLIGGPQPQSPMFSPPPEMSSFLGSSVAPLSPPTYGVSSSPTSTSSSCLPYIKIEPDEY